MAGGTHARPKTTSKRGQPPAVINSSAAAQSVSFKEKPKYQETPDASDINKPIKYTTGLANGFDNSGDIRTARARQRKKRVCYERDALRE
jgi:hypothetical protein